MNRIGAWASDQSQPLADRATFEKRIREVENRFDRKEVPRPPHWGGYRVALESIKLADIKFPHEFSVNANNTINKNLIFII